MTRMPAVPSFEGARETAGRTLESLGPYAATARDTAVQYADEARQRLGPALEAAVDHARSGSQHAAASAREGYARHVAPRVGHAFAALPQKSQENALKAVHRAQEAALAARHSADHARAAAIPVVHEAHARGTAALTALQGRVSAEEIGRLAERHRRGCHRRSRARLLALAGLLAIGGGLLAWGWCRRRSEPEWLVEPPEVQSPPDPVHPVSRSGGAAAGGDGAPGGTPGASGPNGSGPAAADDDEQQDGPEQV